MSKADPLWELVAQVPQGKCVSYGALGAALPNPISGYFVGKRMGSCPEHLPWWRVVLKDGSIATGKRDPRIAAEQRLLLEAEGVAFVDERVDMGLHGWEPT